MLVGAGEIRSVGGDGFLFDVSIDLQNRGSTHPKSDGRQKGILLVPQNTDERCKRLGEITLGSHRVDGIDGSFEAPICAASVHRTIAWSSRLTSEEPCKRVRRTQALQCRVHVTSTTQPSATSHGRLVRLTFPDSSTPKYPTPRHSNTSYRPTLATSTTHQTK